MVGLRRNRRTERAGVNALRTLLEDAGHIVQEIDGGNDHGEDLYVRFVHKGRLTSAVAAVQVKSGVTYRKSIGYAVPVEGHARMWRTSNIPVIGVVYDPEMRMLYWRNMSEYLQNDDQVRSVPIGESDVLTTKNVEAVCSEIVRFIRSSAMELRPSGGQSLREMVADRIATSRADQQREQAVGGNPNVFFADFADTVEANAPKLRRIALMLAIFALVGSGLYTVVLVYTFAARQVSLFEPGMWTTSIVCFSLWALSSAYGEWKAGRRGIVLQAIAIVPLVFYCSLSQVQLSPATADTIAAIGIGVAGFGMVLLLVKYTEREMARRRRLRAAFGEGGPAPS